MIFFTQEILNPVDIILMALPLQRDFRKALLENGKRAARLARIEIHAMKVDMRRKRQIITGDKHMKSPIQISLKLS